MDVVLSYPVCCDLLHSKRKLRRLASKLSTLGTLEVRLDLIPQSAGGVGQGVCHRCWILGAKSMQGGLMLEPAFQSKWREAAGQRPYP